MFSKLLGATVAVSTFLGKASAGDVATATFGGLNGIDGYVMVTDGTVTISLDFSDLIDMNLTGLIGGEECFTGGLKYHIHEDWTYDNMTDRLSGECARTYTGNHWDPWLGCGAATDNDYCASDGGCVAGSSILGSDGYSCSAANFATSPYACEVGDWNGKYGNPELDENNMISVTVSSPYEASASDLVGKSVVFHCGNDGSRAFCAPFSFSTDSMTYTRPTQSDDMVSDVEAVMGSSYIQLMADGSYGGSFDISGLTIPMDCGDSLLYRIYNSWTGMDDSYTSGCSGYVGDFYDPTVSCAYGSDSQYCNGTDSTELCGMSSYSYSCDYTNNRFGCAPGDLSGKYGELDISGSDTAFSVAGTDPIMIDLSDALGKSVVLQCADTYEIVACAKITTLSTADDDSSAFGLTLQLGTALVVLFNVLASIQF